MRCRVRLLYLGKVCCHAQTGTLSKLNSLLKSVHNTWVEHLWYDVTHEYGQKWKNLFLELETHYGLNPTNLMHIWLLHHLFLEEVNQDAQDWAES